MARWTIGGAVFETTPSHTWTDGTVSYKARWRASDHPRDRRGRFVETGDRVELLGGVVGTYQGAAPGGRIRVRVAGESRDRVVLRRHATFPGDAKPTAPAKPKPATPAPDTAPLPPTGEAANGKATLVADSQRNAINDLGIDAPGSAWPEAARAGAAALRAKKPMTAEQAEALAEAVQAAAETAALPKTKKNSLNRGAERLLSLAARLRGFDPAKAPTTAHGAEKITPGQVEANDYIALPGPGGNVQVFKVLEAVDFYGDFKFTLQTPSGGKEVRYVYPDTDTRRFPAANSVADAVKALDADQGEPGKPKGLYDGDEPGNDEPNIDAFVEKLLEQVGGPPKKTQGKKAAVADPGAVSTYTMWYDHLTLSGSHSDPIPVSNLTIEGYTVTSGIAYRRGSRSVLVELKPGESEADAKARGDKSADLLEQVLGTLPPEKAAQQRGLALLQGNNPADSYWAKKYNMPGFHSAATGGFGNTTIWGGDDPKPTTLAHEFGHTMDSTAYGTNQWLSEANGPVVPGQTKSWKAAAQDDQLISGFYGNGRFKETRLHPFVKPITVGDKGITGYGAVDVREDFAESVRLWLKDRRESKIGFDPTTGDNLRFSDLFPERAKQLDAVFGVTTNYDTPVRQKRRKELEDAHYALLKKGDGDASPPTDALMAQYGLGIDDISAARLAANERLAKEKADAKLKAEAAALKAKLAADKLKADAELAAQVASVTSALAAGHLAAADAKKFRAAVTRYKAKLREQGFTEAEIAQMAAAYETSLIHKQLGLGEYATPKASANFSLKENKVANELLDTAGTVQHPLAVKQYGNAQQAKANIAAELASRLNNPEDWDKLRAARAGSQLADQGSFDSLSAQQRQEYLASEVSDRIQTWASNSGDSDRNAVLMQEAVKQEFGLNAVSAPTMEQDTYEVLMATRWPTHGPWYQRVARAMYEHTQEEFAKKGITHISVYRGMRFSAWKGIPDWAQTSSEQRVTLQPVNSWSARRATSKKFVDQYGSGAHKVMLKASFPVELVLGSALTGFGCLNEQEYVIFDADGDINVELLST